MCIRYSGTFFFHVLLPLFFYTYMEDYVGAWTRAAEGSDLDQALSRV